MTTAQSSDAISPSDRIQAEFEQFAAGLVGVTSRDMVAKERLSRAGSRGPKPSISAECIFEHALELVDQEGIDALTVRRLAAHLKISTRTLYKPVTSRTHLVRNIGDLFASRLNTEPHPCGSWESAALKWCMELHRALTSHPHLAELVSDRDPTQMSWGVDDLVNSAIDAGISRNDAVEFCGTLAGITLNDALAVARSQIHSATGASSDHDIAADLERRFTGTIGLILDGVHARTANYRSPPRRTERPLMGNREAVVRG